MTGLQLTPTKKRVIVTEVDQSNGTFSSAARLVGCNRSTAKRIYERHKAGEGFYDKPSSKRHRPKKLSDTELIEAEKLIYDGKVRNAADLQRRFHPNAAPRTVRENLQKVGLNGRIRRVVPFISDENRASRVAWARSVEDWPIEMWTRVIFSDESKFKLFGSDGKTYCQRRDGDALLPQFTIKNVKGSKGKVNVWGCITSKGVGKLIRVEGNLEQVQYSCILGEGVVDTLKMWKFKLEEIIFQQDNDPKHTSGLAY